MSKVRINDLARELEVKSKQILDALQAMNLGDGKTHSSSIEEGEAERVRIHLKKGNKPGASAAGARVETEIRPKIDLSGISKPGDALKAILASKQQAEQIVRKPVPVSTPTPTKPATPASKPVSQPPVVQVIPARPEPRRIVPQPRPAPSVIAAPAIAVAPPAKTVIARPPAGAAPAAPKPASTVAPPAATTVVVRPSAGTETTDGRLTTAASTPVAKTADTHTPPSAGEPTTATDAAKPVKTATESVASSLPEALPNGTDTGSVTVVAAATTPAISPATPLAISAESPVAKSFVADPPPQEPAASATPAAPVRRVIMPQTGPRPTYKAPIVPPATPRPAGAQGGLERGKPIFERRPTGGPGGYPPRPYNQPGQNVGGPRPKHPTRPGFGGPGGPGARPGFGAPRPGGFGGPRPGGFGAPQTMSPPGEPSRPQRPSGPARGRGRQQYPKTKEGPMKGFVPPPRLGGAYLGTEPPPITREITVTEGISVKDLAEKLEIRAKDLIATLLMRGVFVTVNQSLDAEMVKDVAARFGAAATVISYEDEIANQAIEEILESDNIDELEVSRSPVVTVMGHVDHGKTSLLDAIRETDVASGEAGGITQHIGAYKVRFSKEGSPASGREIVFLDTPGHEAFTRMRARGAKVTDLVVIVVAADDGPMPQTIEAIDHAKAANVPIIVAINKIDKPEAQPDRVMKQLADRGLVPEEWGGETVYVPVSAKKRLGLDQLLEMICLVSDVASLKCTPGRKAVGTVLEAKLDRGRGAVASVLVQNGTLRLNDSYIVGNTFGKVRAMFDDRGRSITEAGPSTPVEVLGLEGMPDSGDTFLVVADRDKAKGIAQYRKMKEREAQLAKSSRVSLEGLAEQIRQAGVKDLPIILKGDVTGSVEVLADSLVRMSTEKVRIKVIHSGVGAITESDILLASASNAIVIGFNVRPERKAAELAQQDNVEIRLHSIIYELQDEIRKAMLGLLDPTFRENYIGRADVANIFRIPKVGTIAGCRVTDGVLRRDAEVKILRDGEQVFKGKIGSLRRVKDDVKEVTNGMECGVGIAGFGDLKEGDVIEAFSTERIASDLGALTSASKA